MSIPFSRAPHIVEGAVAPSHTSSAPNAALLVDFDNVTMGMRSDLSKELKTLLNSDVIRGKVTVQRAYADWRRYPQYIVPLSEASIDLIFAPAYGSSKKNATDIRMAIDGMELVFTRPEIGTYILLTGDSDFSSLVLKLKEYGKYVIGVGIQESSSDILVQNCDEYYSYTALSGLRKTDDETGGATDPWVLVERAVEQMTKRGDVMRSDRLKQVMLEIDPGFDEKGLGFNKFSRFVSEASKKGLIQLRKMENGQYEILRGRGGGGSAGKTSASDREGTGRGSRGRPSDRDRTSGEGRGGREPEEAGSSAVTTPRPPAETATTASTASLEAAYTLLREAISDLLHDHGSDAVRDSDVKRRMLALRSGFDEAQLGFPKFSRFLRQAHDHEVVDLRKGEGGNYHVALGSRVAPPDSKGESAPSDESGDSATAAATAQDSAPRTKAPAADRKGDPPEQDHEVRRLRPREAVSRDRKGGDGPPPLLEGQVVSRKRPSSKAPSSDARSSETPDNGETATSIQVKAEPGSSSGVQVLEPESLRLPTGRDRVVQYLSNSYAGVGKKTAETLVDALGESLFVVLQQNPGRVEELLPPSRAERVLEGWQADFKRRKDRFGDAVAVTETTSDTAQDVPPVPEVASSPAVGQEDSTSSDADTANRRRGRRTRGGGR